MRRRMDEDGSVLFLVPAIALLTVSLAALVVDLAYLYSVKAKLENRVEAAAAAAVDQLNAKSLYQQSRISVNATLATAIARDQLLHAATHGYRIIWVNTAISGNSICVRAIASVDLPAFGDLLGKTPASQVSARSKATLAPPGRNPADAPEPRC